MKVCLAALIPLLACLLVFPSDVSGRRRIRQKLEEKEDVYEISHIRKREMLFSKLPEQFKSSNLAWTCVLCHRLYGINKRNCMITKHKEKYLCYRKAIYDPLNFISKWYESAKRAKSSKAAKKATKAPTIPKGTQILEAPKVQKTPTIPKGTQILEAPKVQKTPTIPKGTKALRDPKAPKASSALSSDADRTDRIQRRKKIVK